MLILLVCLAAIAVHRIWNYEEIFAPVRASLGAKVLIDPAWNGLWIAPLVAGVACIQHEAAMLTLAMLACYPVLRGLVAVYDHFAPPAVACSPCAAKRKALEARMAEARGFAKRIILLGSDHEQANWLAQKHPDWLVTLFGMSDAPKGLWKNVRYQKVIPTSITGELQNAVFVGGNATVVVWGVTHTQPWAQAVAALKGMRAVAWVHVGVFDRAMVPAHHRLIAPGEPVDSEIHKAQAPT